MTSFLRKALLVAAGLVLVAVPFVLRDGARDEMLVRDRQIVAGHSLLGLRSRTPASWYARPDYASVFAGLDAMNRLATGQFLDATARFLASLLLAPIRSEVPGNQTGTVARPLSGGAITTGGGVHSDAWWQAIAICEQGGNNSPYFGYFSIMDGSAGGKPWADQVEQANGIISRYGDGAWASVCVARAYAAAPSG